MLSCCREKIFAASMVALLVAVGDAKPGAAAVGSPFNFNSSNLATIEADDLPASPPASSRYFFNLLDHRSKYATGFFPGGIVAAAMPAQREIAETWYHYQRPGLQDDLFYNEVKWGIDQWTFSFEAPGSNPRIHF